jgi:hypothetical protein
MGAGQRGGECTGASTSSGHLPLRVWPREFRFGDHSGRFVCVSATSITNDTGSSERFAPVIGCTCRRVPVSLRALSHSLLSQWNRVG